MQFSAIPLMMSALSVFFVVLDDSSRGDVRLAALLGTSLLLEHWILPDSQRAHPFIANAWFLLYLIAAATVLAWAPTLFAASLNTLFKDDLAS